MNYFAQPIPAKSEATRQIVNPEEPQESFSYDNARIKASHRDGDNSNFVNLTRALHFRIAYENLTADK